MTGLCYGRCHGGPYDGLMLAHNPSAMQLAVERHRPFRAMPGVQASSDPAIGFCGYVFDAAAQVWHWKTEEEWRAIRSAGGFAVDKKLAR